MVQDDDRAGGAAQRHVEVARPGSTLREHGCGLEQQLESAYRALQPGKNPNFYRPGAYPAVVIIADANSTAEQVRDRALAALAQECRLMVAEGVVAEAADIDLCMLLGAGWPFHLGGMTPYLKHTGHL